ncbi:MAG: hypothetical protein NTW05_27910 [Pseudonocardiales bacterium]|jgi:hypothetical protein|nr:hypothetical protein [Pseudonocardiales bacterium]
MPSYEETNAAIAAACDIARQALGPLQQAHDQLDQARGALLSVVEESARADAEQAITHWSRAMEEAVTAMQGVSLGVQTAESHAAGT